MPSTTALFTGLTGLNVNARRLDVIGNNIANVNTTAFKSARMMFESLAPRNFSLGSQPNESSGGTNPNQVGLGAMVAGVQKNFSNGAITTTGVTTDIAIDGEGLFAVDLAGERLFTRAGALQLDQLNQLTTIDGGKVLGFGIDENFNVVPGQLVDFQIPVGTMTIAEETENATFIGNLNASGAVATTGSTHDAGAFFLDAALTPGNHPTAGLDLTVGANDLYISDGLGGSTLAIDGGAGTILTVNGVEKGGTDLGRARFAFSATAVAGADAIGTSLGDFMDFLEEYMGLDNSNVGGENLGGRVSFDGATGVMTVTGNEGVDQQLLFESTHITASNNGAGSTQPFVMTQTGDADGESARTSLVVYDSLGSPLTVDLTMVLQSTTTGVGTTWTYIAESSDNAALDRIVGTGTLDFDFNGNLVSSSNSTFTVQRDNGAANPVTVEMQFQSEPGDLTALASTTSTIASTFQDGSPIGTLSSFVIGEDGEISGAFSNGINRTLGQIALAMFVNPEGLVDKGNNYFSVGLNSGDPLYATPLDFGSGRLIGGALEQSNVDLSEEFINLILTSTGYSAASRVITTTDELMDQLLVLAR
jgi:flagellar hook protein FlgE